MCILVSGRENYELEEQPEIAVRILNKSSKEAYLMRSLDGSVVGDRLPKCQFKVISPSGRPVERVILRCGNQNRICPEDFVVVPPHGAFNPFDGDAFPAYAFPSPVQEPGTYTVQFHYWTIIDDIRFYAGRSAVTPEVEQLFARIAHTDLKSKELQITFRPKSK